MRRSILVAVLALIVSLATVSENLVGEEIRIETEVFAGSQEEPVSQSATFFQDGVVYDFRSAPEQVTVFKKQSATSPATFVLLDPRKKLRTEIPTGRIEEFMVGLKKWAGESKDPLLKFTANPQFKESFEDGLPGQRGELLMASEPIKYRLTTIPSRDEKSYAIYREYNDWNAKLNTMIHVGSTPPFPKLVVSEAMARRKVLAEKVELTIHQSSIYRPNEVKISAVHDIRWRLSNEDRKRIEAVQADLVQFKAVSFDAFRGAAKVGQK